MEEKILFEKISPKKAVINMTVPTIISSLVLVIYNMADTFFVGQTQDPLQVAAVSITNPVFVIFMAISQLIGIGGSAAISIFLGKNNKKMARLTSAFCCYSSIILGIILCVFLFYFMDNLLKILGADSYTYNFSKDYLFYIGLGTPFILFANIFGHTVRGEGAAKASMIGGVIGTIVNIVLDPVFIICFNLGTAGAAIATVIGNIAGCIYYFFYFKYKSPILTISFKYFSLRKEPAKTIFSLGIPAGINSTLMSISTIVLNNILLIYGNNAVAAMGIVTKVYLFIVFIHMGIANGVQPLLGYCYGAKLKQRFIEIFKFSIIISLVCGTILTIIYIIFSSQIVGFFIQNSDVIDLGKRMLIATSLAGPILGIMFLSINSMQALNCPVPATVLSFCRQGLFFIPLLFGMNKIFGLIGVNFTQTISDYLSIFIGIYLLYKCIKNLK